jgi:DNA-binding response OmpR family regulator
VSTETLIERGWVASEDADKTYVWVTMRRLRQKIEIDPNRPQHLLTVRGIGYRLVATSMPRSEDERGT